jgi:hypothetical protein
MGGIVAGLFGLGLLALLWIALLFLAAVVLFIAWNARRALFLRAILREKGYDWVTLADARLMALRADTTLLRQLPDRDELGAAPGYRDGDALALADFAHSLERSREAGQRKESRRRRKR